MMNTFESFKKTVFENDLVALNLQTNLNQILSFFFHYYYWEFCTPVMIFFHLYEGGQFKNGEETEENH